MLPWEYTNRSVLNALRFQSHKIMVHTYNEQTTHERMSEVGEKKHERQLYLKIFPLSFSHLQSFPYLNTSGVSEPTLWKQNLKDPMCTTRHDTETLLSTSQLDNLFC